MPTSETAATFAVDPALSTVPGESPGVTVARIVSRHLTAAGVGCSEPTAIESGARFTARIADRELPVLVGPAPARSATASARWFFAIGTAMMPSARLIGAKDEQTRSRLAKTVVAALTASPGVEDVAWDDIESWSGRGRRRRSRQK